MKRAFFLAMLGAALLFTQTAFADNPISLAEYRAVIAQVRALAQQANTRAANERAPQLNQAAALLENARAVKLPSGAEQTVDNTALIALVRDARKTELAVARLTALENALAQPLVHINPNDLAILEAILSRPPFVEQPSALPTWLQDILRSVLDYFDRLASNTMRGVFEWRDLVILIGIFLVLGVLIYFIRNLRRNMVQEDALATLPKEHSARTPGEAFNHAQFFMTQGDYRNAVRQLYLATLLILDQRGKIKYDPTLTNREYLHQTANDPRTTAALAPIVETFDRTWYGFEPITPTEFDAYRARVEKVQEL